MTCRWQRPGGRRDAVLVLPIVALLAAAPLVAEELAVELDPAATEISFTLGATLHTVHGSVVLAGGKLRLDTETGAVGGEVRVDARSAETGNRKRDRKMHRQVLRSEEYPQILLRPESWSGALARDGTSDGTVVGRMVLLGEEHEIRFPVDVTLDGERLEARFTLEVPYVEWGLEDPSSFVLRVEKSVEVEVVAVGRLLPE